jgi:hypothetical protein
MRAAPQARDVATTGNPMRVSEPTGRGMSIATRCRSVEQFVSVFRRYADVDSIFIATLAIRPPGFATSFVISLANGAPVLRGAGVVAESWDTAANRFHVPGFRLVVRNLTQCSQVMFQRLLTARVVPPMPPIPAPPLRRPGSRRLERPHVITIPPRRQETPTPVRLPTTPFLAISEQALDAHLDAHLGGAFIASAADHDLAAFADACDPLPPPTPVPTTTPPPLAPPRLAPPPLAPPPLAPPPLAPPPLAPPPLAPPPLPLAPAAPVMLLDDLETRRQIAPRSRVWPWLLLGSATLLLALVVSGPLARAYLARDAAEPSALAPSLGAGARDPCGAGTAP